MSIQQAEVVVSAATSGAADHSTPAGNKKTSNNQGRGSRGGGSRPSSKGHQGHTPPEEGMQASAPRKKPANLKDKESKSRPSNHQYRSHVGHKEGSRIGGGGGGGGGGGASQHIPRNKNGDLGHGHHHTNRHRTGNSSVDGTNSSSVGKSDSRILSANRFEKLELDPDHDTSLKSSSSGESLSKSILSISSTSSSSNNLSSSTGSSHRVDERRPGKERGNNRGGRGNPRGRGSAKHQTQEQGEAPDGARSTIKEERYGKIMAKEDGGQKKKSPKQIKFDLPPEVESVPQTASVPQMAAEVLESSGESNTPLSSDTPSSISVSGEGDEAAENAPAGEKAVQVVESTPETKKKLKIVYDRDALLTLKDLSLSHVMPPELAIRASYFLPNSAEKDEPIDESKPKTALTLIKEHDKHFVSKVSLSPQRRSFQRGCSWKDRASNSDSSQNSSETPPPKLPSSDNQNAKLDGQKSQGGSGSHGPRVIHHVPLRDQEQASERLSRKGWRQGHTDREGNWKGPFKENSQYHAEPEPEWMEFGPTDRFDVIELKGFEEHELEREAYKDSSDVKDDFTPGQEDLLPEDDVPDTSEEREEDQLPNADQASELKDMGVPSQHQEDNEFIIDGFDFSTGVSICQDLDLDEDEGRAGRTVPENPSLLLSKDPTQLGNVLMKALGVDKDQEPKPLQHYKESTSSTNTGIMNSKVVSSSHMHPVNALTLDEIHARENIHPGPSHAPAGDSSSSGEGMEAFNKLLAVLESKQSKPVKEDYPSSPQEFSMSSGHTTSPSTPQNIRIPNPEKGMKTQVTPAPVFRYPPPPMEKELLDIDEDLSAVGSNMPFPEPNLRRLEQLERMLETMDRMDPSAGHYQGYPAAVPQGNHPPLHVHRSHHQQQHIPVHPSQLDRDGRGTGWVYQQDRARTLPSPGPTPQQLAAARQHQMLTNSRSANNWAVEMEQRRVIELREMQLAQGKELYGGSSGGGMPPQRYVKGPSSKPNISLLPTAVMRHIHTNKPNQTAADLPKTTSISNRLDQDLTSKASRTTHSVLSNLLPELSGPNEYSMHGHQVPHAASMRMVPPLGHVPPKATTDLPPSGSVYPRHNIPMSHGVPVHNPYMY